MAIMKKKANQGGDEVLQKGGIQFTNGLCAQSLSILQNKYYKLQGQGQKIS